MMSFLNPFLLKYLSLSEDIIFENEEDFEIKKSKRIREISF
jgi:hypothetical protein